MRFRYTIVAGAVLGALSPVSNAADRMAPIEVTADVPEPNETRLFTFETAPALESSELLREIPGVSGARKGGHGTDPSIRGLSETRLNVLIDGAYIHGGCPSRMDPPTSYAPMSTFEEVTVVKGMQSLEYGSGGPGGTILLDRVTDRFEAGEGPRGLLEGGYRSNSRAWDVTADVAAGTEKGFARFVGLRSKSKDYEDGAGRTVRSSYRQVNGTAIVGYTPSDAERLELSVERNETKDILFPGLGMDAPYANNTGVRLKYRNQAAVGPFASLKGEVYRTEVDHRMDNYTLRTPPPVAMRRVAPSESNTTGGRLIGEMGSDLGRWKLGLDTQHNYRDARRENSTGVLQSVLWPGAKIWQAGLFAELTHPLDAGNRLLAGLRYDRVKATADQAKVNTDPALGPPNADKPATLYNTLYGTTASDRTENNIGGLLRFEHDLAEGRGTLYAGLSRTVRTADATERYIASWMPVATKVRVGNPGIEPEKHHQAEIGMTWKGAGWKADGSLYVNKVSDYILRDRNLARNEIYRNIDATLYGGEANLTRHWSSRWSSTLGVAYVHAQNDSDDRPIAQTPPLEGNISLDYKEDTLEAGARVRMAATQTRVDTLSSSGVAGDGLDARKTPGWAVLDLYGRYHVNQALDLALGVDNVLDHTYAQHMNLEDGDGNTIQVNEPGRAFWLKATAVF